MKTSPYVPTDGIDTVTTCQVKVITYGNFAPPRSAIASKIDLVVSHHIGAKDNTSSAKKPTVVEAVKFNSEKVDQFSEVFVY